MPVFVIPGNHDAREPLRAAFGGDGYLPRDGFLHYAVEDCPVRLIALDTLVPGERSAANCAPSGWLGSMPDAGAAAGPADRGPDAPSAVCDRHRAHGPRPGCVALPRLPRSSPATARSNASCAAICTARSTAASPALSPARRRARRTRSASTSAPSAPLRFVFEPPGYQLHLWRDGGLVSHTAVFGDWPGPYPLRAEAPQS